MFKVRRWATRHAGAFEAFYAGFEKVLIGLHPLFNKVGYARLDKPFVAVEKVVKGFLFDSKTCGSCTLGSTGMTCPMNCPKKMRNGPCGGVRQNGHCEVNAEMPCVWRDAYAGSQQIEQGVRILQIQPPLDHRNEGTSSWLREVREKISKKGDNE